MCVLILLLSLALTIIAPAGTYQTQLIVQPIIGYGEAEPWDGESFRIVDVPFLKHHFQGHPAYEGITHSNVILTNAPRSEKQPESNLLSLMGISIIYDFASSTLWLHMSNAHRLEGWPMTVKHAGFAALECIRLVAHRYSHRPKVLIRAQDRDTAFWKQIEQRFASHYLSKPFRADADNNSLLDE